MHEIDAIGRCFLAVMATGTFVVATCLEVKYNSWQSAAVSAFMWAIPWVVGLLLALSAASGSTPW